MKTRTFLPRITGRPWAIWKRLTALLAVVFPLLLPAVAHAQGAIQTWVQRYNGPGNGGDYAAAVAVDSSDNIIVTGLSRSNGSWDDYATIKYSNAGVPLWTNRYNGPGNSDDRATALVVDGSDNVIVAGYSYGSASAADYLTIKYSNAGVPLWTNRYNGPGNSEDRVSALAVDGSNNIVVTGWSDNGRSYPMLNYDYLTIKYSSAGAPLWTNRYNGPGNTWDEATAVAVDASGNVFVTGSASGSGGDFDCATIKYSSAGVPLWTNRYNGPGNTYDRASNLAVDRNGNVIVTGYSRNGSSIDYLTIQYSGAGVPLWTNLYNGPVDGDDYACAVAVDGTNNVIVTGYSSGSGGGDDYLTIQYSSVGVPLWTNRYDLLGNADWISLAVAVGANNNVILAGYSYNGVNYDYMTIAYSSVGVPLWTNRYNGPANDWDEAKAVTVDSRGNVFVTGGSYGSGSDGDYATIKYSIVAIITRQPLSRTNAVGTAASFFVEAAGGVPMSYQWRKDGANLVDGGSLSGVTTTNLLIANVQPADAAGYSVVVTNAWGSVTSSVAQLTVTIPPSPGRFTNFSYSPATGFSFIFRDGTVGRQYRIQTSSSLEQGSWVEWESFTYNGPKGLMDVGTTGTERRFYRAVSP